MSKDGETMGQRINRLQKEGYSRKAIAEIDIQPEIAPDDFWDNDEQTIVCGACQAGIEPGKEIMVTMEKFTHHERTWPACSEECANILRERV